ncbi:hypothetical protein H310_05990 [Aphanomyces invadans]|uniref:Smr domain-containing protein n=1 Tax=Aphanomyces invadans TaxID=157072 RepID=A0A024U8A2_9STRA|nr:hypothetical protein H310_05990 [Aphanomyces invadans]ETW02489.1 hypothetical protein H310_05990 [Aphanomyces invadans]|eukprot:XP_008869094.1 hypothetical protein H310_05990 [Aphanomyces invadans]
MELQEEMQVLHTEALRKLGSKGQHHLGVERTRRYVRIPSVVAIPFRATVVDSLATLRAKLQVTREHAAYAFFVENQYNLVNGNAVDLHGLYVQEAYQTLEYCVSFCRENKIRKFVLITGVGNHLNGRGGRMYTTFPVALRRRGVAFTQHGGQLTVYPSQVVKS